MSLKVLFDDWSNERLKSAIKSQHYGFLLDSKEYFDISVSKRTVNSQFHLDCEPSSPKNIFGIIDRLLEVIKYEEGYKSPLNELNLLLENHEEKIFLHELSNTLKLFDVNIIDTKGNFLCIILKNNRETRHVSSVMHYARSDEKENYNQLIEYTTQVEKERIENFFEKNNISEYHITHGPEIVLCIKYKDNG